MMIKNICGKNGLFIGIACSVMLSSATKLFAENEDVYAINISSQNISDALRTFAKDAGIQIVLADELADSYSIHAVKGEFTLSQALDRMLEGTGLVYEFTAGDSVVVKRGGELSSDRTKDNRSDSKMIEEMIVTAARREQNLQDVPAAVVSLDPVDFSVSGMKSMREVLAYVPGVNFTDASGPRGYGKITMRSVGQLSRTPVVGIYLDDVPVTGNTPAGAVYSFFDGLLGDIERIEIVKGPQGTLYGAGAIGGALKYVTRAPSLDEVRGSLSSDFSTTQNGGFNKTYTGRISIPVINDKLGISFSGFYDDNAGYVDRADSGSGMILGENFDVSDTNGVSGDLLYKFSENFDIRLKAIHQKTEYYGQSLVRYDGLSLVPRHGKFLSDNFPSSNSLENKLYSGTLRYDFGWAELVSTSAYVKDLWTANTNFASLPSIVNLVDMRAGNPPGTTFSIPNVSEGGSDKIVQEIRLVSEKDEKIEWISGIYYTREDIINNQVAFSLPTNYLLLDSKRSGQYEEYAVFGNVTYYINPALDFTLGLRLSDHKIDDGRITTGGFVGPSLPIQSVSATVDTYLLAARYRVNEDLSLYARAASGFRPATTNLTIVDGSGAVISPALAESDSLWSYEVGAKGNFADGKLSYDLALYYIDWQNFQIYRTISSIIVFDNARDGIAIKGFEAEITLRPFDNFSIVSSLSYSNSSLNSDEPSFDGLAGQPVPGEPKLTAATYLMYEFPVAASWDAHLGLGFTYTDKTDSDFEDGVPSDPTRFVRNVPSESYLLADLNAGISKDEWAVNFYVTNIFNKYAVTNTSGEFLAGNVSAQGVPLLPRTVGINISVNF